jgi:threonine aldolase
MTNQYSKLNISNKEPTDCIDFRSDTVTLPSVEMFQAIVRAKLGDDVYGEDRETNELQDYAASLLGKEAALFFPTGTQSNLSAILSHCQRGDEVLIGREYHTNVYEAHGASVLGGVGICTIDTNHRGSVSVEDMLAQIKADDPHFGITKLLCLENTVSGRVQPQSQIDELSDAAHAHGLKVHLDGARLFNAHIHSGLSLKDLCYSLDSISICLSKGLGTPAGSLLVGDQETIRKAKRLRKILGGGMRQVGVLAACGMYALQNNVIRLQEDHDNACRLTQGLSECKGLQVGIDEAQTNMTFFHCPQEHREGLQAFLLENNILVHSLSSASRLVCHLDISKADVDFTIQVFQHYFNNK